MTMINLPPQLLGNLRREFLIWKSYKFNAAFALLMWGIIFPLLIMIIGSSGFPVIAPHMGVL